MELNPSEAVAQSPYTKTPVDALQARARKEGGTGRSQPKACTLGVLHRKRSKHPKGACDCMCPNSAYFRPNYLYKDYFAGKGMYHMSTWTLREPLSPVLQNTLHTLNPESMMLENSLTRALGSGIQGFMLGRAALQSRHHP